MKTLSPILLAAALLSGCKETPHDEEHASHKASPAPAGAAHEAAPAGSVTIDPEMLRDLRITTAPAEARSGGEGVMVLGELRVDEDADAEAGSPVAARDIRILAAPGDTVKPGQALVELQSVELGKARAELLATQARAELARQTLSRKRVLVAERIAPERELEEAKAEATAADANLRAARASLRALGLSNEDVESTGGAEALFTLRAPISGIVLERSASAGRSRTPPGRSSAPPICPVSGSRCTRSSATPCA
jgi:cobalt-zinc-cadmium efflux system membrane fusion protein